MKTIYYLIVAAIALQFSLYSCNNSTEEKTEQEETGETNKVQINKIQLTNVGIKLGHIERRAMSNVIHANGELAVAPQDEALAAPLFSGIISRICVIEGQYVKAGQPVAYIENTEIVAIQQNYLTAAQEAELAQQEYNRQKALSEQGAGVRRNLEQAEATLKIAKTRKNGIAQQLRQLGISANKVSAGNISNTIAVTADISGIVSKIFVKTGSFADMQTPVVNIVNNNAVFCELQIFEKSLPQVHIGQNVDLKLTNSTNTPLSGIITDINRAIDPETRTINVRVKLNNHDNTILIPGMAVTALINTDSQEVDALPDEAVVTSGGKSYIFVLQSSNKNESEKENYNFVRTEVVEGIKALGYTQIIPIEPLPESAIIAVANAFYLNSMASDHGEED
jgi:cobalt-zinc-cadmium efflux system membrane fusion protein